VLRLGADVFVDLQADLLDGAYQVDLVFDVMGRRRLRTLPGLLRAGGRIVTIAGPATRQPEHGKAIFFVVEPDRTVPASRTWDADSKTGASGRSSAPCGPWPNPPPHSHPTGASKGRPSSRSWVVTELTHHTVAHEWCSS
jgi:hypothetical protein